MDEGGVKVVWAITICECMRGRETGGLMLPTIGVPGGKRTHIYINKYISICGRPLAVFANAWQRQNGFRESLYIDGILYQCYPLILAFAISWLFGSPDVGFEMTMYFHIHVWVYRYLRGGRGRTCKGGCRS